jgi:hypothetical protein
VRALPPPGQKRRGNPALQVRPLREQTWRGNPGLTRHAYIPHVYTPGANMYNGGSGWVSSRFPAVCTPQMLEDLRGRPTQPLPTHIHISIQVPRTNMYSEGCGWVSSRFPAVCTPQILEDLRGRPTQPQPPHIHISIQVSRYAFYPYIDFCMKCIHGILYEFIWSFGSYTEAL